jgi:hypothetical protein
VFPWLPVPRVQRLGFILPRAESPSAFCHHLSRLSDPSVGAALLEVSRPFNGILGAASLGDGFALPAGLRSRVFSTPQRFLQHRVPRPCFMPQPFVSFSLQSFPLAQIVSPSRGHQLPCGHPPDARKTRRWDLIARDFTDSHARGAVARIPRKLWTRFPPGPKTLLPARPGSPATGSPPLASFTRFEALLPPRIRSHRHGFPRADGRCSPGLLPLQRPCPPCLGACDPPEPEGPHATPTRRRKPATQGTSSPPTQVRPNPTPKRRGQPRWQSPVHFWTGPRHPSVASPSPLAFSPDERTRPRLTFGAS